MTTIEQSQNTSKYNEKWQERFAFFDAHGAPSSKTFKAAAKELPFKKKLLVCFNVISFFFGFIHLFVWGLWKRNLAMMGVMLITYVAFIAVFAILNMEFPDAIDRGLGIGFSMWYAISANYAYYLKEVKGYNGWNPFKS